MAINKEVDVELEIWEVIDKIENYLFNTARFEISDEYNISQAYFNQTIKFIHDLKPKE